MGVGGGKSEGGGGARGGWKERMKVTSLCL